MRCMDRVRRQIGLEEGMALSYTGKGIGVAVLDSGVMMHSDLQGRIMDFYDFLSGKHGISECVDDFGHGTQV